MTTRWSKTVGRLVDAKRRARAAMEAARSRPSYRPPVTWATDDEHPERLAVLPHMNGLCVEIGCGHRKTLPGVIGIDMIPGGQPGLIGNVTGQISQADIAALGDALPLRSGSVDALLARHNLEHYVDTAGALQEWHRVLKPGGQLMAILPDEEHYPGLTVRLDPTHYHAYTRSALARLVELVGFEVVETRTVVPKWSFMLVARRPHGTAEGWNARRLWALGTPGRGPEVRTDITGVGQRRFGGKH